MRVQNSVSPPTLHETKSFFKQFSFIGAFQSVEPPLLCLLAGQMVGAGGGVHCLPGLREGPLIWPLISFIADRKVIFKHFCQVVVSSN